MKKGINQIIAKSTIITAALFGTFLGSACISELAFENEDPIGAPQNSLLEDRAKAVAFDYGYDWTHGSKRCVTAAGTRILHIFQFTGRELGTAAYSVDSEKRGLSRFALFFDNEQYPLTVIDGAYKNSQSFWYTSSECDYTLTVDLADFSQERIEVEMMSKKQSWSQLKSAMKRRSASELDEDACQFNNKILNFAQANLYKKVGNGQCWTLANNAVVAAGGHEAAKYNWGSIITRGSAGSTHDFSKVKPGDIIQYDGTGFADGSTAGDPVHTAIVKQVFGTSVEVYEQNAPVENGVRLHWYHFGTLQSGGYIIYRSYPADDTQEVPAECREQEAPVCSGGSASNPVPNWTAWCQARNCYPQSISNGWCHWN